MTVLFSPQDLDHYQVSPERGFLPTEDPLRRLPPAFSIWEEIAADLPKLLTAGVVREALDAVPPIDTTSLRTDAEWERAMLLLSYFGHAYVWGATPPADRIPAGVAVAWHAVARHLGRPPVLSYASYALHNWRRLDPDGPVALGNIGLLQNFLAGLDEEWFVQVHVDIEAKAGVALAAAVKAEESSTPDELRTHLEAMAVSLEQMYATLERMPEGCDPYIYYHRVRPYIHGWKNHPVLTEGVIYEGVDDYAGRPQQFRGETGAQSSIVPALDGALGIDHRDDPLRPYLMEMREYMPLPHRRFIECLESESSVRERVVEHAREYPGLRDAYNACVTLLGRFRTRHLEYAVRYIQQQARGDERNPGAVGTGGTPFLPYLKKHRDETEAHLIR
jgi:indoleamine 2,3-dioxygenase